MLILRLKIHDYVYKSIVYIDKFLCLVTYFTLRTISFTIQLEFNSLLSKVTKHTFRVKVDTVLHHPKRCTIILSVAVGWLTKPILQCYRICVYE